MWQLNIQVPPSNSTTLALQLKYNKTHRVGLLTPTFDVLVDCVGIAEMDFYADDPNPAFHRPHLIHASRSPVQRMTRLCPATTARNAVTTTPSTEVVTFPGKIILQNLPKFYLKFVIKLAKRCTK